MITIIGCVLLVALVVARYQRQYTPVEISPGLYLSRGNHGKFSILLDRMYESRPAGTVGGEGGSVQASDVAQIAVQPGLFVYGSGNQPNAAAGKWFLFDLRIKPKDIDAEFFPDQAAIEAEIKSRFGTAPSGLKKAGQW